MKPSQRGVVQTQPWLSYRRQSTPSAISNSYLCNGVYAKSRRRDSISSPIAFNHLKMEVQKPIPLASASVTTTAIRSFGSGPKNRKRGEGGGKGSKRQGEKKKTKNQTTTSKATKNIRRKDYEKNQGKKKRQNEEEVMIPPALLAPTGSRNVFVAQTALGNDNDNNERIDPSILFDNCNRKPKLFTSSEFEYMSPSDLKHEYPDYGQPEIAFLGRSNVGKSSLCNALMSKKLCITSKSPGRTQLPYYYGLFPKQPNQKKIPSRQQESITSLSSSKSKNLAVADALGYLIDLPGYGYAAAPSEKVEDWQSATQQLLLDRRHVLKRVFLLVDTRREGLTEFDMLVIKWLEEELEGQIPYSVVLTKADRTSPPSIIKQVNQLCLQYSSQQALNDDEHGVLLSPIFHVTSARDNIGINELLLSIEAEFLGEEEESEDAYDFDDEHFYEEGNDFDDMVDGVDIDFDDDFDGVDDVVKHRSR